VDCLDRLRNCGETSEVTKSLGHGRDELDFTKMAEYSRGYGNKDVQPVAGVSHRNASL
jgi:predicted transcriptional regulator of viral defense system